QWANMREETWPANRSPMITCQCFIPICSSLGMKRWANSIRVSKCLSIGKNLSRRVSFNYLGKDQVRGVLLWNGQVDAARQLISEAKPIRTTDLRGRLK